MAPEGAVQCSVVVWYGVNLALCGVVWCELGAVVWPCCNLQVRAMETVNTISEELWKLRKVLSKCAAGSCRRHVCVCRPAHLYLPCLRECMHVSCGSLSVTRVHACVHGSVVLCRFESESWRSLRS
jgi:hypothetical protein